MVRKPKTSRLSLQTRLAQLQEENGVLQEENDDLRAALEDIADILEDCGILDSPEPDPEDDTFEIIPGTAEPIDEEEQTQPSQK